MQVAHFLDASLDPWFKRLWAYTDAAASASDSSTKTQQPQPDGSALPQDAALAAAAGLQSEDVDRLHQRHPVIRCRHLTAAQKLRALPTSELHAPALRSCTVAGGDDTNESLHVAFDLNALAAEARARPLRRAALQFSKAGKGMLRKAACATAANADNADDSQLQSTLQIVADAAAVRRAHSALPGHPPGITLHLHSSVNVVSNFPLAYAAKALRQCISGAAVTKLTFNVPMHSYVCRARCLHWLAGLVCQLPGLQRFDLNSTDDACNFSRAERVIDAPIAAAALSAQEALMVAIARATTLQELRLGELWAEGAAPQDTTAAWLSRVTTLTRLDVKCMGARSYTAQCAGAIVPQLAPRRVQHLSVTNMCANAALPCEIQAINRLTQLTSLTLEATKLPAQRLQLDAMDGLRSLQLSGQLFELGAAVSSADVRSFGRKLAKLPALRALGLHTHGGRPECLPVLAALLAPLQRASVTWLSLLQDDKTACENMPTVSGLAKDAAVASIARTLQLMQGLQRFEMCDHLARCGGGAIPSALAKQPELRFVEVKRQRCTDDDLCSYGAALSKLTHIASLHLIMFSSDRWSRSSVVDVARTLPKLRSLRDLWLQGLCADEGDVRLIGRGVAQLPHLRMLAFNFDNRAVEMTTALAPYMRCLRALTSLRVLHGCNELEKSREGQQLLQGVQQATGEVPEAVIAPLFTTNFQIASWERGCVVDVEAP